ncbi:hypothetical protein Tco_1268081, partial [Tanacetum coccineum]
DLVYPSLDDFVNEFVSESVVEKPTVETNEPKTTRKENRALIIEDLVSESEEEDVPKIKTIEMFNKPSFAKINFVKSTKQVKSPRNTSVDKNRQNTPSPRGNKRNWNQQMSQKLGNDFDMFNKSCHVWGSFEHLRKDCNNWPNAVVNTPRPKAVLSDVKRNKRNVVKASACWVWRPKHKVLDHVFRNNGASMSFKRFDYGSPQQDLNDKGVIDSGCSRHMTGNRSYLTDYKEIDGGFVAFGGNSKGGKITGKGKIRTGKLDFEDVYFVKELKFNLFSVSHICDKKSSNVVLKESHLFFAKATPDESNLLNWRLTCNFKTMNKWHRKLMTLWSKVTDVDKWTDSRNRYLPTSKAFRVFNSRTRIVEENLHVKLESETVPAKINSTTMVRLGELIDRYGLYTSESRRSEPSVAQETERQIVCFSPQLNDQMIELNEWQRLRLERAELEVLESSAWAL